MGEIFAILILYYIKLQKLVTTVSNFEEIDYLKKIHKRQMTCTITIVHFLEARKN